MKVIVLGARRYSFASKDTGELIEGVKVSYLEPIEGYEGEDTAGNPAMEIPAPMSLWDSLSKLPAVCDVELSRRPGRAGRPETMMTSCKVVARFDVGGILQGNAQPSKATA